MSEEETELREGVDYISKESYDTLNSKGMEADNNVVNMMAEQLNKIIEKKQLKGELKDEFCVIGEDLFSALHHDTDLYTLNEIADIKEDYKNYREMSYIFVIDSNYTMHHTVLFVVDNKRHKIDFYDTLKRDDAKLKRKELQQDFDLLKSYYHLKDYEKKDKSNFISQQKDNESCAFYCGRIIEKFIEKGKYELDDSFKKISVEDVENFKRRILNQILKDVHNNIYTKEQLEKKQEKQTKSKPTVNQGSKKPKKTVAPNREKIFIPKETKEVYKRNTATNKSLEEKYKSWKEKHPGRSKFEFSSSQSPSD